jgi:hypothetical protein
VLCVLDSAQDESKADFSVFAHELVNTLKTMMDNTTEGGDMRIDCSETFRDIAFSAMRDGIQLANKANTMMEVREDAGAVHEHLLKMPALAAEMDAFNSAAEILLKDVTHAIHGTAKAIESKNMAGAIWSIVRQLREDGCSCETCSPPEKKEGEVAH